MKHLIKLLFAIALCLFVSGSIAAQEKKKSGTQKTLDGAKKATIIVVGQTAKLAGKATKFAAKEVVKPIIIKSAPKLGKFALKQSGKSIKAGIPIARKLFVQYVKYKFLP